MNVLELDIPKDVENLQLPSEYSLNFFKLREQRIFYVDYEIDDTLLELQKEIVLINLEDFGKPIKERMPIKICIFTNGGSVASGFSLVDTILSSETPIYTYNMGLAMSCGLYLFICGQKRFTMSHSRAMLHRGSAQTQGTFDEIEQFQKDYRREVNLMKDLVLSRTNIDEKLFDENKSKDWYFDSDEQIKYGIATDRLNHLQELYHA